MQQYTEGMESFGITSMISAIVTDKGALVQLVVKDGFKVATQTNTVLAKASTIVNHVHKCTVATELLEGENKLQSASAT